MLKFDIKTNSNELNSIVMFTFFVLVWKDPFLTNLVLKIKIVFKMKFGRYSRLSILRTPDIANISILRTEVHFPLFYSKKSLINPFYITTFGIANPRFHEPNVLSRQLKIPRYNELKALNTTESKLKI